MGQLTDDDGRCPDQTSEVYKRQPPVLPQPLENLGGLNDGAQTRPPRFTNANRLYFHNRSKTSEV